MINKLIKKYYWNQTTPEEELRVRHWLGEDSKQGTVRKGLEEIWLEMDEKGVALERDMQPLLHRIHHSIRLREKEVKKVPFIKQVYTRYSSVAAMLFVPVFLVAGYFWFQNKKLSDESTFVSLHAPVGSRLQFELPDGSSGWLNGGTRLQYKLPFQNDRRVKVEGEAFFAVSKDKLHPFNVKLGDLDVEVLGTRFNVFYYPEDGETEVVLEEGSVQVSLGEQKALPVMHPGEKLRYDHEKKKVVRQEVDPLYYTAWTKGLLMFRNETFEQVAKRLGHWYNADVVVVGEKLKNYHYRATFKEENLIEVLELLKQTAPIDYKIVERQKNADSTFSRKKIIVYSKHK